MQRPTRTATGQLAGSVVYLLRDYPSLSQTFVRNEIVALRERGRTVHVFALRTPRSEHVDESWGGAYTTARRQPTRLAAAELLGMAVRSPRRLLAMARQLRDTGRQERWSALYLVPHLARSLRGREVIACHTHFAFDHAWATLYLARLLGVPASITVHAADIYRDPPAAVRMLRHFDSVVTVCAYNVEFLRSAGLVDVPIHQVPCGVDVPPAPLSVQRGATQKPASIVSVGRFVPKKGYATLLRAWPAVLATHPTARLEIVGDGPMLNEMKELAAALDIADHVTFLGARAHEEVLRRVTHGDVFVLACAVPPDGDSDALPVAIREAMARARPVVSTQVAGVPEALGDTGWVVPPGDDAALAAAIVEALDSPDRAAERGRAARKRVIETATLSIAADRFEQALLSPERSGPTR